MRYYNGYDYWVYVRNREILFYSTECTGGVFVYMLLISGLKSCLK